MGSKLKSQMGSTAENMFCCLQVHIIVPLVIDMVNDPADIQPTLQTSSRLVFWKCIQYLSVTGYGDLHPHFEAVLPTVGSCFCSLQAPYQAVHIFCWTEHQETGFPLNISGHVNFTFYCKCILPVKCLASCLNCGSCCLIRVALGGCKTGEVLLWGENQWECKMPEMKSFSQSLLISCP